MDDFLLCVSIIAYAVGIRFMFLWSRGDSKETHRDLNYHQISTFYCTYVDIQKFNTKYLVMYKVQMHTGTIS